MKNKVVKMIIRYFLLLLVAIVVGVNVQSAISSKLAGNAVPMPFGIGTSVVLSGSMEPELSVGDIIIIKEPEKELEIGDVIVYQTGSTATVHKIVKIDGDSITTKGDANNVEDAAIDKSAVKGIVVMSLPLLGYVALFAQSPIGIIAIIAVAIILLERSFRNEKKQKEASVDEIKKEIQQLLEEKNKK